MTFLGHNPTLMVPVALFGWVPVVLVLFYLLPPRWAVITSYIGSWLFLPLGGYSLPIVPTYDKTAAATLAVVIGAGIFDAGRVLNFRFRKLDLIVVAFTLAPFLASVTNGLGVWDGLSVMFKSLLIWGLVYFIGRLYIDSPKALRELAIGIVIGGLVYLPLCLWEIRMSPQLNREIYGFYQQSFAQVHRWGGYRPMVFMQHGLMVADWMMAATLCAFWLWISGSVKRLWLAPMWACFAALAITTVLCKSTGAMALLAVGIAALGAIRLWRTPWPLVGLAAVPVVYIVMSIGGVMPYDTIVHGVQQVTDRDRADSLRTRFHSERLVIDRAVEAPLLGLGGHDRWTQNSRGDKFVWGADQLWVITFGKTGLLGLGTLLALLSIPPLMCWWCLPRRAWTLPATAPVVGLAVVLALFAIDCLFNAMLNPVYVLVIGGAAGLPVIRLVPAAGPGRRAMPRPAGGSGVTSGAAAPTAGAAPPGNVRPL